MDVYVVLGYWRNQGSSVLGAAADKIAAEEIADRALRHWGPWSVLAKEARWCRDALPQDGVPEDVWQEIVKVPLAGLSTAGQLPAALGEAVRREMAEQPIIYHVATEDPPVALRGERFLSDMRRIGEARALTRADDIRIGEGPAWEWLKAGLDKVATYPSDRPIPDSRAAATIWGLPVILDPNIPPNEIHVGDVVYVVGPKDILGDVALLRFDFGAMEQVKREFARRHMEWLREAIRSGEIWR